MLGDRQTAIKSFELTGGKTFVGQKVLYRVFAGYLMSEWSS
jgi:hypothetical protein